MSFNVPTKLFNRTLADQDVQKIGGNFCVGKIFRDKDEKCHDMEGCRLGCGALRKAIQ